MYKATPPASHQRSLPLRTPESLNPSHLKAATEDPHTATLVDCHHGLTKCQYSHSKKKKQNPTGEEHTIFNSHNSTNAAIALRSIAAVTPKAWFRDGLDGLAD